MLNYLKKILDLNLNNRKIVLRGCPGLDPVLENQIKAVGYNVDLYVSRDKNRIDKNKNTFDWSVIKNQSDNMFIIFNYDYEYFKPDWNNLKNWGYNELEDFLFINHYPIKANELNDEIFSYGNTLITYSADNLTFSGIGSHVKIGKNVSISKPLNIRSGVNIEIGNNVNIDAQDLVLRDRTVLKVGDRAQVGGFVFINNDSELIIGKYTTTYNSRIRPGRNTRIIIGEDVMFSWDVAVLGNDGHMIYDVESKECLNAIKSDSKKNDSVIIGDHVWLGGETAILPGTSIGSGSMCGYRSLVKGKFSNNVLLVGSPARVYKKNVAWARNNIDIDGQEYFRIPEEYRKKTE